MGALSFSLDSVDLRLCFSNVAADCFPAANGSVGMPVVRLFDDLGGNPSTELFTFTNPLFAHGIADYTFLPPGPFTLTANTSYWIVLHSEDGGDFSWKTNDPQTLPTGAFALHLDEKIRGDAADPPTSDSDFLNIYTVNGTPQAVPEPSTIGLLAIGLIGLVLARRRKASAS